MKIALVGNPNCGKSTLFNALTGKMAKVGNWSGVTVDDKLSRVKKKYAKKDEIFIVDLPGTYNFEAFTPEEKVTIDYIVENDIDIILNVIDGNVLQRSVALTEQLLELNKPVVIALNKIDLLKRNKIEINFGGLSDMIGCSVVPISAEKRMNLSKLIETLKEEI